jgi:hypothetical protein
LPIFQLFLSNFKIAKSDPSEYVESFFEEKAVQSSISSASHTVRTSTWRFLPTISQKVKDIFLHKTNALIFRLSERIV